LDNDNNTVISTETLGLPSSISNNWGKFEYQWNCPLNVQNINIALYNVSTGQLTPDYGIDDISILFNSSKPATTPELEYEHCLCIDMKNLEKVYKSDYAEANNNAVPSTTQINTYLAGMYNESGYGVESVPFHPWENVPTWEDETFTSHPQTILLTADDVASIRSSCTLGAINVGVHTKLLTLCDAPNDCEAPMTTIVNHAVSEEFEKQKKASIADFIASYKATCFNLDPSQTATLKENFSVEYSDKEYQFTLYYYDQAGNLTRTVPPEGVHVLSAEQTNAVDLYRKDKTNTLPPVYPSHSLVTLYEYNSLNQLTRQRTPDADADNQATNNSSTGYTHYFWYDKLGRIVASQNTKQKSYALPAYNYTVYDALGRPKESGELLT
jgi:hypothetical protein